MKYRAEIDGLRAIAVIPVILFHAGFESFNGGYVGVDVFFVVSGYLITTIILSEMEQGRFSIVNFYERRARRILPALFLIVLVSLPFAWMWLKPADMRDYSQSLVAVSTFVSNILFWRETGYWDAANEFKPLLHTWSLAVEEQYYVLFPLFLMVMWQVPKRWLLVSFISIAVASLMVAQLGAYSHVEATFYLLPTRGWELAIGAIIAYFFQYKALSTGTTLSRRLTDEILSLIGLWMIGYAVFIFDETLPFPSFYALVPTIGTALIIGFSSPQTLVGRALGTKILVGIGLISYSAYLWHYPIFVFARHWSLTELRNQHFVVLTILTFLLAYLSWRYVERRFRKKDNISRKTFLLFATAGTTVFILIGLAGQLTDGFDGRSKASGITYKSLEDKLQINPGLSKSCEESFTLSSECRTSEEPEIVVWGDSFAMHLVQGVIASKTDASIIQMTKSGCGPFFDVAPVNLPKSPVTWARGCLDFTADVREWLQKNDSVKYALISSIFVTYLSENTALLFRNGDLMDASTKLVTQELMITLDNLKAMGITPVIFSPPPTNYNDLGRCLVRARWLGQGLDNCNFQVDQIPQEVADVYRVLENIDEKYRVIRLDELICPNNFCKTHIGSTFIFRDTQHFSLEGSIKLGEMSDFYRLITKGHLVN